MRQGERQSFRTEVVSRLVKDQDVRLGCAHSRKLYPGLLSTREDCDWHGRQLSRNAEHSDTLATFLNVVPSRAQAKQMLHLLYVHRTRDTCIQTHEEHART